MMIPVWMLVVWLANYLVIVGMWVWALRMVYRLLRVHAALTAQLHAQAREKGWSIPRPRR